MLFRSSLRHLWQQRGLSLLALLAIGLAVSLCVAVWQTNSSAVASFATTAARLQGVATHVIKAGPHGIDHRWYAEQRRNGTLAKASPKIQQRVLITAASSTDNPEERRERATVLGIDAFAAGDFVDDFGTNGIFAADTFNQALRGKPLLFGQAGRWPDTVTLWHGEQRHDVRIIPTDAALVYLPDMLIGDIATVDTLLGSDGFLSEIDVILPDTAAIERLQAALPSGAVLRPGSALGDDLDALTAAFRLNLGALSGLACLVAIYLVISTVNLWTVERQPWFAHLRTIGAAPRQIVTIIFSEAVFLGLLGAVMGFAVGQAAAVVTSALTAQTVQDFYANIPLLSPRSTGTSLLLAVVLGPLLAVIAAIPAAIQCWRLTPRQHSLQRHQTQASRAVWLSLAVVSGGFFISGWLVITLGTSLGSGWIGMITVIFAITGLTPLLIWAAMLIARPLVAKYAPPSVILGFGWPLRSLLRLGPATAALTLALAASLGVAVMVNAFRSNVTDWLGRVLSADIYISGEGNSISDEAIPLPQAVNDQIRALIPNAHLTTLLQKQIITRDPHSDATLPWTVSIFDSDRPFAFATVGSDNQQQTWQQLQAGSILISEPLARQRGLQAGDQLRFTDAGISLPIAALVTDFTPDGGRITMLRTTAAKLGWAYKPSGVSIRFPTETTGEQQALLQQQLVQQLAAFPVRIQNSQELRATSLQLFDRTFTITTVLQVLTALVAAAGMVVAGMAHQFERRREWAMLRSMGAAPQHIRRIIMTGQILLGCGAGLAAIPFGILMAWLLAAVINLRSFGWSLQLHIDFYLCAQTFVIAVITAAIAGWLPARLINKTPLPEAMRWE